MEVRVPGRISKVQASLDFYLQLTSVGKNSLDDLRKQYFSQFLTEELERRRGLFTSPVVEEEVDEEDVVEKVSGEPDKQSGESTLDNASEGVNPEELKSNGVSFLKIVSSMPVKGDNAKDIKGTVVDESDAEYTPVGRYVDNDIGDTSKVLENQNKEYVNHGRYVDDIGDILKVSDSQDKEYVDHGRYVEDVRVVEEVKKEEDAPDPMEYVPHGRYVDEENQTEKSIEAIEEPVDEESEDDAWDFEEEDDGDSWGVEDSEVEDEPTEKDTDTTSQVEDGLGVEYSATEGDDLSWLEDPEEVPKVEDVKEYDDSEEPNKIEEVPRFRSEVSLEDEGRGSVDVPADIREFLRQHPCSPIDYVLKFYSKKEIDKAIALGRVYKKKGKLMI